ncbi:MAG: DUF2442 domain-containing protein [Bacteroidales bacterium]|nr:DUF2442 domain-containing protein [Bacteroidales bacterium]
MKIEKIWTSDDAVWIRTSEGNEACEYFADYPRLRFATAAQRNNYMADDFGIHWPDIDEDLCFEGFFKEKNQTSLYRFFMSHPELNAAAIARRMGMKQSLLAAYISGSKKPSEKRKKEIIDVIRQIGDELKLINF